MGKNPAFLFYPGDWVQDTRTLSLRAKGAWIDLLCAMWRSADYGRITLSWSAIARLLGTHPDEARQAIEELVGQRICDTETDGNGNVTLACRRMIREEMQRKSTRLRVQKFRNAKCNARGNADVTPASSVSVSSICSSSRSNNLNLDNNINYIQSRFSEIWARYPVKDGRKEAERHFRSTVKTDKDWQAINVALDNYLNHLRLNDWKKPKNGKTWFNNWRDWVQWEEPPPAKKEIKEKFAAIMAWGERVDDEDRDTENTCISARGLPASENE